MSTAFRNTFVGRLLALCLIVLTPVALLGITLRVTAAQQPAGERRQVSGDIPSAYILEREIDLSGSPSFVQFVFASALRPQADRLYLSVSAPGGYSVVAADLENGIVTEIFTTTLASKHLIVNADGSRLFAISDPDPTISGTLTIFDLNAGQILTTTLITVSNQYAFRTPALGPNNRLYVAQRNEIHTLDGTSGLVLASTPVSGTDASDNFNIATNPQSAYLYAFSEAAQSYLFVRYAISSSLPTEAYSGVRDNIYSLKLLLTPDGSSLHNMGVYWPGPELGIGRLTTDTFALQQLITGTYVDFDIDPASEFLYAIPNNGNVVEVYDAQTSSALGTFVDPDMTDHPGAVFGLPNGRFATLFSGATKRLRIFKPATTLMSLPVVFNNYCSTNLYDDFSNPASGWPIASNGYFDYRYLNGEYDIHHIGANRWTAVTAGHEWENRTVQVSGRVNAGDGVWGLILGIAPDWSSFFTFEIDPVTATWYLFSYNNSSGWQLIRSGTSGNIGAGNNTLRASGTGLYINNAYTTDFVGLNAFGRVGFTSAAFVAGSDFRYDNYYFVRTNCPEPPGVTGSESAPAFIGGTRAIIAPRH